MIMKMSAVQGEQISPPLLPAVWKLLRLRWRTTLNSFRHAKTSAKVGRIVGMLLLAGFGGFIFWLSWVLLNFLRSSKLTQFVGDTTALLDAVPVLILTVFFMGILITSFGVLLQALYLSGDMDFLLAAPIPIRAVFITKLLQAILPNFGLTALFGLPVLVGLGLSGGYSFWYFPFMLILMISLSLAAAGLAGLLVMLVVRIFPARRVVEVLGFVGAIISIVCSQTGNLMNSGNSANVSQEQVSGALGWLVQLNNPWIPLNWPGRGLVALGEGNWLPGFGLTLLSLGLTGGLFWLSLVTAERWYFTGWAGMQVVKQKKQPTRLSHTATASARPVPAVFQAMRLLSAPVRGMIWKDYLMMRRDLRHLSQLITPLIFGIIYGIMFLRSGGEAPAGRGEAPDWFMSSVENLLAYGSVFLAIFVGWMLLQRLAGMGFSQEGKNYWMLKAAPVSARQMLRAKFLVAYLPALVLSVLFMVVFSILQRIGIGQLAYSLWMVALCLAGMAGIQLAFGAAGANFNWEDPRKMNAGNMGCLGMVLTSIYVPVNLGLFIGPLFLAALIHIPAVFAYLAGGVLGSGMSLLCAILPPRLLEAKVSRLGE
jgi:ABC-2 type transport system permease protein